MTESEQKKLADMAQMERGPVLCACGDKLPIGTYYCDDESSVHVHHGRTECRICDHPDRKDAKDLRTQPVTEPPGATCEEPQPKDIGIIEPCGNLLPCSTHPTKACALNDPNCGGDHEGYCMPKLPVPPSGDVVRDEE